MNREFERRTQDIGKAKIQFIKISIAGGYGYLTTLSIKDWRDRQWWTVKTKCLVWDNFENLAHYTPIKFNTLQALHHFVGKKQPFDRTIHFTVSNEKYMQFIKYVNKVNDSIVAGRR